MHTTIALLRGINVGGNRKIKMADLRALWNALGMTGMRTILQSGNVVFQTDQADRGALATTLEAGIEREYGFHSDVLLRTLDEVRVVVEHMPFPADVAANPSRLLVMFLAAAPDEAAIKQLQADFDGPEYIQVVKRDVYLYYPDGQARSKLNNAVLERALNVVGTARNWNTVTKLLALAEKVENS